MQINKIYISCIFSEIEQTIYVWVHIFKHPEEILNSQGYAYENTI